MSTLTNNGFLLSDSSTELQNMQQLMRNVFGALVNLSQSTITGSLTQELAKLEIDVNSAKTILYSGLYNPDLAYGIFLDSILKFDDIVRLPATSSVITAQLSGTPGTIIPKDSQAITTNNDIFKLQDSVTLDGSGNATGIFYSVVKGTIPVTAGILKTILTSVIGWISINNLETGKVGSNIESDYSLRNTRRYKLGINSANSKQSLIAAFEAQQIINDFIVLENNTDKELIVGTLSLPIHSVSVVIAYVNSTENNNIISQIFYNKLAPGVIMNGDVNPEPYTDPKYPWSIQQFNWYSAITTPLEFNIIIAKNNSYSATLSDTIKQAVVDAFNGNGVIPKVRMGTTIYADTFLAVLFNLGVYNVIQITVGRLDGIVADRLTLDPTEYPTLDKSNINITFI